MNRIFHPLACLIVILSIHSIYARDSVSTIKADSFSEWMPKEENKLVIYTSHVVEVYRPIIREFEEQSGIWVEVLPGGTAELLKKIQSKKDSPGADLIFGGGVETLEAYKQYFLPYKSPHAANIQQTLLDKENCWTPFSRLPIVLVYNTKLLSPTELTGWSSLTNKKFAGKIALANPAVSGSSYTALLTWLSTLGTVTAESLKTVSDCIGGGELASSKEILPAVEQGDYLVGIILEESSVHDIGKGANLAIVYPQDGTSCVSDGAAIIKNARHIDNARKFIDFIASRELQQFLSDKMFRRSVRVDIKENSALPNLSTLNIIQYDSDFAVKNRDKILSEWSFLKKEDD